MSTAERRASGERELERAELARLLPAPSSPDLPEDRYRILKEHVMQEIMRSESDPRPRPSRWRRLSWVTVPVTAVIAALVVMAGWLPSWLGHDDRETSQPAASVVDVGQIDAAGAGPLLQRISLVVADKPVKPVRDHQFVYIESKNAHTTTTVEANGTATVTMQRLHSRQVWLSVDGSRAGWLVEAATPDDPRNGISLGTNEHPSLNAPTYRYLESLPTNPDALLKKIYDETRGAGNSPDQEAFTTIGDLLRESLAPPKLSAALYQAAAKIPNVVLVPESADAIGRHGVAVAHVDEASGRRDEWIFDRASMEFLGERSVQVKDRAGLKAGTVTGMSAVLARTIVNEIKRTS